jgi:hypothetical protein
MPKKTGFLLAVLGGILILVGGLRQPATASAAPSIYASPIEAGCYLAKHDLCKIHVDPFTIDIASGQKLVQFSLVTLQSGTGILTTIYDFRTDLSNPPPYLGSTYSPSLVAKDFGATCGQTYTLVLEGQDTGDSGLLTLGNTTPFTCPKGTYFSLMPMIKK